MRRQAAHGQRLQTRFELTHAIAIQTSAIFDVLHVIERCQRSGLRQRIHVERLPHTIQQIGDGSVHDAISDAKCGEPMRLGKSVRHDQIRITRNPCRRVDLIGWIEKFVVRLVENDDHVARHARDERFDSVTREPGSRRIVRIRDEHQPRARRDRFTHRNEIVPMILRGHLDAERAARLRRERIHDERVLRIDCVIARCEERLRDQLEHVVAAVAEHDLFRPHAKSRRQRRLQRKAVAVRIPGDVGGGHRDGGQHLRTRTARIFVRRKLDDRRRVEIQLACDLLDRLAADVGRDRADVFGRTQSGRMDPHACGCRRCAAPEGGAVRVLGRPGDAHGLRGLLRRTHVKSAGYDPSNLRNGALPDSSASAVLTLGSSR